MAKPKGSPKTGGKVKGSKNKRTVEAIEIAERLGVNPFEVVLLFAKGDWKKLGYKSETVTKFVGDNVVEEPVISPELRSSSAKAACEYLYPKRKAIEQTIDEGTVSAIVRTIITKPADKVERS